MRIAICTDQYLPLLSGLVDSVETLAKELRTQGHTVRIYTASMKDAPADTEVFRFPAWYVPGSNDSIGISLPIGAMRDIRTFKPDAIHTQLFGAAGFFAWYAARRLRVPLIGTDHTFPADYLHYLKLNFAPFPYLVKKYAAWYYGRCDFVTTPSERMLEELRVYGMKRPARIISNPIPHQFRSLPNKSELKKKFGIGEKAIAIFGRIAVEKNLDAALEVFANVAARSDAELVFIGDGPYRAQLEAHVRNQTFSNRVKFLGTLRGEPLVEALNACDLLLITSTSENQPMTLLQAMVCGLPTVAAQAGGLPEYVRDNVSGYIVPPTDKKMFADQIIKLLEDPSLAKQFGEAVHEQAASYRPETIVQIFLETYQAARKLT
jgi:glycosyltransferase involved in cell wall biosynthesis